MPATRPSSSKPRRSKASNPPSTFRPPASNSSKSRPGATKRVACLAWWCGSTFTRRADMMKHVGSEHFGKRFYCVVCHAVMKQESNLNTHLNAHFGNYCTLCSCGRGFTDPSACTRHRDATGHEAGITYRQVRPVFVKPIGIQHLAGLDLTAQIISDRAFRPPPFDESFHLKGMPKPKAQEKYNSTDYLITDVTGVPNIPSAQDTAILPADEVPPAEYQELPVERPAPVQAEIYVEELCPSADFSYDVELLQDYQSDHVSSGYMGVPCYSQISYPSSGSAPPPSFETPHHNFFEERGFNVRVPGQFQQPQYQPYLHPFGQSGIDFRNYTYQPALAAY